MIRSSKFKSSIVADVSLTDFISMFNFFTGLDCRSSEDIIISIMKSDGNVVDCIIFDDAVSVVGMVMQFRVLWNCNSPTSWKISRQVMSWPRFMGCSDHRTIFRHRQIGDSCPVPREER